MPTLKAWFQRGHVRLSEDDGRAAMKGLPNRLTLRTLLMFSVTSELVRLGTPPAEAFKAAEYWMRTGEAEGQCGAPAPRENGGLYPSPYMTYLTIGGDGPAGTAQTCRITAVDPQDRDAHSALFNTLFFRGRSSAKIVLLNLLDSRVRQICHEAILGDKAPPEPNWEAEVAKMLGDERS